jgi:excisionase family DNA binding protein
MVEEHITVKQAANRKGVTQSAIYKAIDAGRLPASRILGRFALKPEDVDACEFGSYAGQKRSNKPRGTNAQRNSNSTYP